MDYKNWMYNLYAGQRNNTLIQNICFPATHDSGTCKLRDKATTDTDAQMVTLLDTINSISTKLSAIPGLIGIIGEAEKWVCDKIFDSILGVSQTTTRTIGEQLRDGIRCLDLRIKYSHENHTGKHRFFTYHGMVGSNMEDVLGDIKTFLEKTSGEIVVVNVGHFQHFLEHSYTEFINLLSTYLEEYAFLCCTAYDSNSNTYQVQNDYFTQTYEQIVTQRTGKIQSTVIITFGNTYNIEQSPTGYFLWPNQYCSPSSSSSSGPVTGSYSDSDDFNTMLQGQVTNWQQADGIPFALYMTLTFTDDDITNIITNAALPAISDLLPIVLVALPPGINVAAYIGLKEYISYLLSTTTEPPWTTINQMSAPIQSQLYGLVAQSFVQQGATTNTIAYIYVDFYENTNLVDLCIALNTSNNFQVQYLTMFGMDSNTFITQQLFPGGIMGNQVFSQGWENNYCALSPYQVGGTNYLYGFSPDSSPANFWFIQELLSDGTLGPAQTAQGNFENTYLTQTTYSVQGNTFLFGMNHEDNYQFTQQLLADGTMASEQAQGDQWENGPYAVIATYTIPNGPTYMFGHNINTQYWFIQELNSDGTMGTETQNGTFEDGPYTSAVAFLIGNTNYLFGFNAYTNYWFVQQLTSSGTLGTQTDTGNWENSYNWFAVYEALGRVFLFGFCDGHNYWFIQEILPDGTFAKSQSSGGYWNNPYQLFGVYSPVANQNNAQ
ncbi:hypothetical protein [Sediminibacterium ginsengisoli]|uniref:Phosphatidylinositol diacylglycerol-lyase n=1 Tax=Sediminibacterium ginsengisoli TaxID=413434 RepID=A0A1T4L9X7_9BACT|nr:hypothetical protein [Sediminibacterium ginsengisoli]SJZ51549.1 hypothetical protein SAMN04488132_102390 [Sediminibacterium ginsengisoli]